VEVCVISNLQYVLCECHICFHDPRKQHRFRVSENKVLRRIPGSKTEELTGGWRTLHNEELRNLYSSINITEMMGFVACTGQQT
jgi:hypothetical protein